jgi:hypothetical protein
MTLLPNTSVGSNDFGQKQNIWDIGDYIVKCNFLAQFQNHLGPREGPGI